MKTMPVVTTLAWYQQMDVAASNGFHVALEGPRGVGKTTAAHEYARRCERPLAIVQCHADQCIEELRGTPGLRDGNSNFQIGPVTKAAIDGHILLMDEVNLARPGVTAWLNSILDDHGIVCIPETGEQRPVDPKFRCILCFNSGYQGTREINQALMDRCRVIRCDYWPAEVERKYLRNRVPSLKEIDIDRMLNTAKAVRQASAQGTLDFDLSIRTLLQWAVDADQRTQDLEESFRSVVLPKVGPPAQFAAQHEALIELAKLTLK